MNIALLVGTRPNFIKAAPLWRAFSQASHVRTWLVHSGQHRHAQMSDVFFQELGLPKPIRCDDFPGEAPYSSDNHATIVAHLTYLLRHLRPNWVVVIGDVRTTLAGAVAAHRLGIPLAHVEAGLRCGDFRMAEERNRILTDHFAQLLFVTEPSGVANLLREGISEERIHLVGNVLIDALLHMLPEAERKSWLEIALHNAYPGQPSLSANACALGYVLCTLHRAENVDVRAHLHALMDAVQYVSMRLPVLFVVHPRTERRLRDCGLWPTLVQRPHLFLVRPVGYSDMVCLQKNARVVMTDSGGIQEETSVLGVPCLTLRPSTERPITLQQGTSVLVGSPCPQVVRAWVNHFLHTPKSAPPSIPLWDGRAAERIAQVLLRMENSCPIPGNSVHSCAPL